MAWNKLRRQRNLKEGSGDYQSVAAAFPGHTSDGPFDAKTKQNKKKLKILPSRVRYVLPRFPVQCFDGIDLYERGSAVLEKHAYGQD